MSLTSAIHSLQCGEYEFTSSYKRDVMNFVGRRNSANVDVCLLPVYMSWWELYRRETAMWWSTWLSWRLRRTWMRYERTPRILLIFAWCYALDSDESPSLRNPPANCWTLRQTKGTKIWKLALICTPDPIRPTRPGNSPCYRLQA